MENTATENMEHKAKRRRVCSYNKDWERVFSWVRPVRGEPHSVFCELCLSKISISHGGKTDLRRHMNGAAHKRYESNKKPSKPLDEALKGNSYSETVTAAEIATVYHTVHHSLSYRSTDCGSKLASVIFPDSYIAKKMSCGRTKAAALVTDVLAPASVEICLKELKAPIVQTQSSKSVHKPFFSMASDAYTHGSTKLFPLSVRYWTPELGVKTKILDFYEGADESEVDMHTHITKTLHNHGLGLDMVSAFLVDNLNYSVFERLAADNNTIVKANCMAHVVHNCAKYAADKLDIDIESVVNKIFSHFASSAKRSDELKAVFAFVGEDYLVMRRHVPTRWLSLWPAVKKLHDCWPVIKNYFLLLGEDQCPKSLWQLFKKDQNGEGQPLELQVYLSFLNSALKMFYDVVLVLEGEEGTVCELYDEMFTLKTKLQKCWTDSVYGLETTALLQSLPDQIAAQIISDLGNFYMISVDYLEKSYNFSDFNYQKHVASLSLKSQFSFPQLCNAVEALQLTSKLDLADLYEEYRMTQPHQQEIVERGVSVPERWRLLLQGTDTPNMSAVASFLLSIPITNASVEKVFSIMTAAWTEMRNRCSVDLIKSEIQIKSNFAHNCSDFYSYVLKEKSLLESAQSSKKYKSKKSNGQCLGPSGADVLEDVIVNQ